MQQRIATRTEIEDIKTKAQKEAADSRDQAWKAYSTPIRKLQKEVTDLYTSLLKKVKDKAIINQLTTELQNLKNPAFSHILDQVRRMQLALLDEDPAIIQPLTQWIAEAQATGKQRYSTHLHSSSPRAGLNVPPVPAQLRPG